MKYSMYVTWSEFNECYLHPYGFHNKFHLHILNEISTEFRNWAIPDAYLEYVWLLEPQTPTIEMEMVGIRILSLNIFRVLHLVFFLSRDGFC